jgi:hypothetical protein
MKAAMTEGVQGYHYRAVLYPAYGDALFNFMFRSTDDPSYIHREFISGVNEPGS